MKSVDFEGRRIPIEAGDTVASALYRAGVRIFSRSFKYHRPRGLYCLSGDCPNCLLSIDHEPAVRACSTPALEGQRVKRETGWPSVDRDILSLFWYLRRLLPVGFYYKTFIRPKFLWPVMDHVIRRLIGLGTISHDEPPAHRESHSHHPDVFVAGAGVAGLSAALAAAEEGRSVVLAEEGIVGEKLPPGAAKQKVDSLLEAVRAKANVTLLERAAAVGIYEGPLVPVDGPDFLHLVHPGRIVVATGAVEEHAVFEGSDRVGVWLGRGAARLAGAHHILPGRNVVFVAQTAESAEHLEHLVSAGVKIAAVVASPPVLATLPDGLRVIQNGRVTKVRGHKRVEAVTVESTSGRETIPCDALVLSLGLSPRDGLLRQGRGQPVVGAGEVVLPGCSIDEAVKSGRRAMGGRADTAQELELPAAPRAGFVCTCEDVSVGDLEDAWAEGYQSTAILKRYTTATMGPCQGAMCHPHFRAFAAARSGKSWVSAPTTARPPARPILMENAAAGLRWAIEHRTALHDRHLARGAKMQWAGSWKRPQNYGDLQAEYWAVRKGVSIGDVGTLGKFLVTGPDATKFLERIYPSSVHNIAEGRLRYTILLTEQGHLFDDGLIGSLGEGGYYLTFTTAGSEQAEEWLLDWAQTWSYRVHIVNQTGMLGAINVAGPRARELLSKLSTGPIDKESFPYARLRDIEVAGVRCRALRAGFLGELSYELHHPSSHSGELWDTLLAEGAEMGIHPHGLDTLLMLRLEKGHIIVGQDTDFDTTPEKVGLDWVVKMEKPDFIGKVALTRMSEMALQQKLVPISFAGSKAPAEGETLLLEGSHIGHLTSAWYSPVLKHGIGLGWVRRRHGNFPSHVTTSTGSVGTVVSGAFYDPKGVKLRA